MPDFSAKIIGDASTETWEDPTGPSGEPMRINPVEGRPPRHWVAQIGDNVDIVTIVETAPGTFIQGPLDSQLGGRLFVWWVAEHPGAANVAPPPLIDGVSSDSSSKRLVPTDAGHYTIGIMRPGGGSLFVHFDVEPA